MCGNDMSTVANPSGDFYTLIQKQYPTRKINLSISF